MEIPPGLFFFFSDLYMKCVIALKTKGQVIQKEHKTTL